MIKCHDEWQRGHEKTAKAICIDYLTNSGLHKGRQIRNYKKVLDFDIWEVHRGP